MAGRRKARKVEGLTSSAKDDRIALGLAQGMTQAEVALYADICVRTVQRKVADPKFAALVRRVRDRLINDAVGVLSASSVEAAKALRKLMKHDDPVVVMAAAKAILANVVRLGTYDELADRIAAIENDLADRGVAKP